MASVLFLLVAAGLVTLLKLTKECCRAEEVERCADCVVVRGWLVETEGVGVAVDVGV